MFTSVGRRYIVHFKLVYVKVERCYIYITYSLTVCGIQIQASHIFLGRAFEKQCGLSTLFMEKEPRTP